MIESRRSLVPLDFSSTSLAALDFALLLASKERGSVVRIVHVVPSPTVWFDLGELRVAADLEPRIRGAADAKLREIVSSRASVGVALEHQLLSGDMPAAIVEDAAVNGCTRIVTGSSRPGPLARVLLGSVADRVMRTSPIDVVVVSAPEASARPRNRIRNVVCATDFSGQSETALLHALEIVRAHDARLHLVHAWEVAPYVERIAELCAGIERDLAREVEATAHRHEAPGVPILRQLRHGNPAIELVRVAIEVEADLVVVGTTGKQGVDRLLLGSVAERIARTSPVPVLVARSNRD